MQGSLVNRLMEHSRYPKIEVGMGGTVCMYSDRHPVTVIAIRYAKDGETVREIDTRGDNVGPNKLTWPAQEYDITPAPSLEQDATPNWSTWRMDQRGRLRKTYVNPDTGKRCMLPRGQGDGLSLGSRDYYQDPSF